MGYRRAGFSVDFANDIDPIVAWHYRTNLNPANYFLCPIRELVNHLPQEAYGIDLLDGSPPCSTFSTAGLREDAWGKSKKFREGQTEQVLSELFFDFLDVAEAVRPRAIIAENVSGLAKGLARGYLTLIFERLRAIGYHPQAFLVDASRCGVPQRRQRVFIVAHRDDMPRRELVLEPRQPVVTAAEACADLQELTPEELLETKPTPCDLKWWPLTSPGRYYVDAVYRVEGRKSLYNHGRIAGDRPAPTLSAQPHVFMHWSECRRLTYREWLRLGSFPDDYVAQTARRGKYMVGMSVPPKMAETVAAAVAKQWLL